MASVWTLFNRLLDVDEEWQHMRIREERLQLWQRWFAWLRLSGRGADWRS